MKQLFLSLFGVLLAFASFSQHFNIEYVRNADGTISRGRVENKQRTGLWVTFDGQGNTKRYEEYKEGQKHGYFVENDEHGHPFMDGWFYEGQPVGKHMAFNHGNLIKVMDFDSSIIREYYDNSMLKRVGSLQNGQYEGLVTQYYDTGFKLSENTYLNGKKTGIQKYYYQNGSLQAEYYTKDDQLEGLYKDFHENGKLATEGNYTNNMKQGLWKEYDKQGKLIRSVKYKNDVEVK